MRARMKQVAEVVAGVVLLIATISLIVAICAVLTP